jgi:preprotein translocase subunit SecA
MSTLPADMRLWHWLGHPTRRDPVPKGLDTISHRVRGYVARRVDLRATRARAESIVAESESLREHGEAHLNTLASEARAAVVTSRDPGSGVDPAFAIIREIIRREMGVSLHVEQIMGALVMTRGAGAEMATGEGKTLTAILPAAMLGWLGHGVHVVTVNDYLAARDAEITGPVYRRLGLAVGVVRDGTPEPERREAYLRSITYASDKQIIFDFLRDRLKGPAAPRLVSHLLEQIDGCFAGSQGWTSLIVQRGLFACVVDEADSVLIDEAVTPAIIATDAGDSRASRAEVHQAGASIAASLVEGVDYLVDRRLRRVRLTPAGSARLANMVSGLPTFWRGPRRREELLVQALTARALFQRNDDYVVIDGKIQIVDASTGRVLPGRQWQLGLHQAVEAKEGIEITEPRRATSRISYQRFFQRYQRLAGMSGTLWEVRHELWASYGLPVVRIPTHKPIARRQLPDVAFATEDEKFAAVADRAATLRASGQPVLIGTRSVASSERMAAMLAERQIQCSVLNANREAEEASIIARAGESGAVTVATNMAGRGTDIQLDAASRMAGGLAVLATERHDERRVDRQLFGRSGRQGDPGLAQAFVSLQDMLIARHGLGPLVAIVRAAPGALGSPLSRLLWRQAQWAAGRKSSMMRTEAARADARLEQTMRAQSK